MATTATQTAPPKAPRATAAAAKNIARLYSKLNSCMQRQQKLTDDILEVSTEITQAMVAAGHLPAPVGATGGAGGSPNGGSTSGD